MYRYSWQRVLKKISVNIFVHKRRVALQSVSYSLEVVRVSIKRPADL